MVKLWNNLEYKKHVLTKYGHWSETGLLIMN